ncbi:jerky protein homolog-like [Ptychodera flava]|uniref:jerky protein homolog-like n=1 Tax=Ptychodera flava TaxID=63121 RepID=UPI003969BC08
MSKRKLSSISVRDKLEAIDRVKKGEAKAKIARDLSVGESTIRGWVKSEEKLRQFVFEVDEEAGLNRKRAKLSNNEDIDKAVHVWFLQERSRGTPLSGPIIREKARILAKQLRGDHFEFEASAGWFWRWQRRHAISEVAIQGEARSADAEAARTFPAKLKDIIDAEGYSDEQVYNVDEAGLFWKLLPSKSQASLNDPQTVGYKQNKQRITVMLTANKSGNHKLRPLIIGRSLKPRCFHHVNMDNFPVVYMASGNAWMTQFLFEEWFFNNFVPSVRCHLTSRGLEPKALLLLDQCPAHPREDRLRTRDGKIRALYLPANTTSLLQPMDQGIIKTFKANYRRELMMHLLLDPDYSSLVTSLQKYTIKDMCYIAEIMETSQDFIYRRMLDERTRSSIQRTRRHLCHPRDRVSQRPYQHRS